MQRMSKAEARAKAAKLKHRRGNTTNRADQAEGRRIARRLLHRPKYRQTLEAKLDDGTLHPSMQTALWYFAYGRPTEYVETTQPVPVRVEHVYSDAKAEPEDK